MMTAARIGLALAMLTLAGCDDRMGDYPALLPTEQMLAEPTLPGHAADASTDPAAVSGELRGRAAALSTSTPETVETGLTGPAGNRKSAIAGGQGTGPDAELSSRAAALRARAAELSKTSLDGCPDGAASCPDADTPTASE
ncbi:hypothetical protein RGQ15_12490 [Paracoccus sp. MBLB3053]|uniref:DUF3035 domain-containing protein n=1 Tax=Paracoccus aurantius TaxID=3073814 RepID=A0ABU2HTL1_9RHOB|nr:hypothetical protein [Paracoccus sp. MBLB3053]MDS9468386.1 hypothetical protein [Paracoccus sp. MBLB3053]